ncbi:MAG: hypothetical protein AAFR17_16015 [Pseudomonadota bacterium]
MGNRTRGLEIGFADLPRLIGRDLGVSPWVEADVPMIDGFAQVTAGAGARRQSSGTAYLALSLLPRLADPLLSVSGLAHKVNYGLNEVRFLAPLTPGNKVRLRQKVTAAEAKREQFLLTFLTTFERREGETDAATVICTAESLVLFVPE